MKKIVLLSVILFVVVLLFTVSAFAANEYFVFDADQLNNMMSSSSSDMAKELYIDSEQTQYLRIYPKNSTVNSKSETFVRFEIFEDGDAPLFNVDEYPFVGISYKTNIPMTNSKISINAGMLINDTGKYERCWSLGYTGTTNESRSLAIYDVRTFSGAQGVSGVDYSDVDPSKGIKFIRIPPWADAKSIGASATINNYFDIEFIGFFKSAIDASAYFDDSEYTVTYYDKNGDIYWQGIYNAGSTHTVIDGPNISGYTFEAWMNTSKTIPPASFVVDTDYEFFPKYTRTLKYYVYSAEQINATVENMTRQSEFITYDNTAWIRYVVDSTVTYNNTNSLTFKFSEIFNAKEYKYFAIKYKSNISTAVKSAISPSLKHNGKYINFWGIYPTFYGNLEEQIMIGSFDSINSSELSGVKSLSHVDDDSAVKNVRFTPWGTVDSNNPIKVIAGEYIDISYIGFFASLEDINEFFDKDSYNAKHNAFMGVDYDLKFRPDENLTRGEAVNIITRIIGAYNKILYVYDSDYTDINKTDDCYSSVAYLERSGYLKSNGGEFKPDDYVTVSDLIGLINKVAEDHDVINVADADIAGSGYITRADAAELFCNLLGRTPTVDGIMFTTSPAPIDVSLSHEKYDFILEACYDHNYLLADDETERWIHTYENNFYMKKAPDGIIEQLNDQLKDRAETIRDSISEWTVADGGTVYYVSNSGNDSNDGKSAEYPFATLDAVQTRMNDNRIKAGDVILFERGGEWYPTESTNSNGEVSQTKFRVNTGITVSAYGEGDKPRILGSLDASGAENWTKVSGYNNIYVFNKKIGNDLDVGNIVFDDGKFTWEGNQPVYENDIGAFAVRLICDPESDYPLQMGHNDGVNGAFVVSNGPNKWNFTVGGNYYLRENSSSFLSDLNKIGNISGSDLWYCHDKYSSQLYLICKEGNPGTVFDRIDLCTKGSAVGATSGVTLDNLCIKFTGVHGVGAGSSKDLTVRNCEIGWIGGSIQGDELEGNTVRLGNAVEVYGEADGFYVYDCFVYQCFDCGPTVQVSDSQLTWGDPLIEKDVHFYGNALWNAALEVWLSTGQENFGNYYAALINCKMYDNLVAFNGYGFQGYTHQKHDFCGFYGAGYTYADYIDCYMENNTFWNLRMNLLKAVPTSVNDGDGFHWRNNMIIHRYNEYLGLLGSDTQDAEGASTRYYYNNETIKTLLSNGAFGYNDFYYTLEDGSEDPAENIPEIDNGVIIGDSDGTGTVDANDVFVFARYLANWTGYSDQVYGANSDINGDNKLSSLDLVVLSRKLSNWDGYND